MLRFVGQGERHPVAQFVLLLSRGHSVADWKKKRTYTPSSPAFFNFAKKLCFPVKKALSIPKSLFFSKQPLNADKWIHIFNRRFKVKRLFFNGFQQRKIY